MKNLTLLSIVSLCLVINQANSQTFTNYTVETTNTRLPSNIINSLAIDNDGNKWFGTPVGVCKFDGTSWTTFTNEDGLVDKSVIAIAIDAQGNKWFGTSGGGVSKFDGTTWTTYTKADGLAGNIVAAIAIDAHGNKWFVTYNSQGPSQGNVGTGVSKFDGTTWITYTTADGLADNNVCSIAIDAQGNKWFGTLKGGVSKFDGNTWTTYTTADGLAGNLVRAIAIDSQGAKWFSTAIYNDYYPHGRGVSKFDGNTWTKYTELDGLARDYVVSIVIDAHGNKWFGTDWRGVSKFDGTNWTTYNTVNGLVSDLYVNIAIDGEGNKWLGTANGVSELSDGIRTGIIPLQTNDDLSLYPNPNKGKFSIIDSNNINSIEIYNLLGKRIYSDFNPQQQSPKEIDLSNFPKGIYFVTINNGAEKHTGKVFIE